MSDRRLEGKTSIEQCRLAELTMLEVFAAICAKHHLTYFCTAGTILGMVRHQGHFIPWDDDIDVNMPLEDYRKFIEIAPRELPDQYLLEHRSTVPETPITYAKIRDRSSFFCDRYTRMPLPSGIFLDIFPFERMALPPQWLDRRLYFWCGNSAWSSAANRFLTCASPAGMLLAAAKVLFWNAVHGTLRLVYWLLKLVCPVGWRNPPENSYIYTREFPADALFPTRKHTFEGGEFEFPNQPEKWLEIYYGNWREPPPADQREWHHSIVCPAEPPRAPWARPFDPNHG